MDKLLEVKNLKTYFQTEDGPIKAVDGVSFDIEEGETLALVGESGCGKTVTALSIMRLIQFPGRIIDGKVVFKGEDLLKASDKQMRRLRGNEVAMIFQEPMSSLNPLYRVEGQIGETIRVHVGLNSRQIKEKVIRLLEKVEIPSPEGRAHDYPHQLSGGMRQRVMVAIALACEPRLLIADEPTTALDVTIQAQILTLFCKLKKESQMSMLLITHDLGIVAEIADRVAIMYAGHVVEIGRVHQIFRTPAHPYTYGLLESVPKIEEIKKRLPAIPGSVPDLGNKPSGCPFHPRCERKLSQCTIDFPPREDIEEGHWVSCYNKVGS